MRYIAPLLCLCAVSALGAVLESPKMGGAVATALPVEADTKMAGTPAMQVAQAVPIEADTKMAGTPAMQVAKAVPVEADTKMAGTPAMHVAKAMPIEADTKMAGTPTMQVAKAAPVEADTKMAGTPAMPVLEPVSMKSANPWTTYDNLAVLSLHLLKSDDAKLKPELQAAFNLTAELQNWKKMGLPEALPFYNDQNNIAYGYMTIDTPVPALYADNIAHEIAPKFHFFNMYDPKDIEGKIVTNVNNLKSYGWDENLPVKFLVHGYLNSIRAPMMQSLKNAYLKSGKYNVMGVNWGDLAGGWLGLGSYAWARGNVPTVAARISMMVDNLIENKLTEAKKVHIIGHSLGAHVAGIAGKNMRVAQIGRITGLDPAKPLFELTEVPGRIHHTDADLVDIIHTNAGMLGRSDLLGSIDFYPNGGSSQINCKFDVFGPCAHARAYELFEKSILNNSLDGVRCDGLPGLESGRKCLARMGRNEPTVTATMGDKMAFSRGGSYFVEYSWP